MWSQVDLQCLFNKASLGLVMLTYTIRLIPLGADATEAGCRQVTQH